MLFLNSSAIESLPPFKWKKVFRNILSVKIHFVKKSRNLSWVGADFSLKWLNFPKNAWNFALVEIWSGCRCDMKIIFAVFDNLDAIIRSTKFHRVFLAFKEQMMAKYFIWKKFSIQVIKHTKNDFHITSTTASNFKQSKISCIFWEVQPLKAETSPDSR